MKANAVERRPALITIQRETRPYQEREEVGAAFSIVRVMSTSVFAISC